MGTPAHSHIHVVCESQEIAANIYKQFEDWSEKANKHQLPVPDDGDFSIECLDLDGNIITFETDSMREQNCQWQNERCLEFFKAQKGVTRFEANVSVQGDGTYWERDETSS